MKDIIGKQLCNLIPKPIIISNNEVLNTLQDQYEIYNIINLSWGSLKEKKHPFFFITGSAGTGKTYLTKQIINYLKSINKKFLLMAPTGIVAENVGGETIHSKLKITEYIIIEKISMVSSQLFTFISKIFCKLHSNSLEFGGIPVLVIGDLAQLPPVKGDPNRSQSEKAFMNYTNYPVELVLSVGTRVMFLNNTQFKHGLYNGSIGIVMKICNQESIEVAFPLTDGIKTFTIQKDTVFFTFNGMPAKRTQFSLQMLLH
ncbi:hypothetical protein RclHR1_01610006 [Rhizophagus clarus]|uniref:ATP-dependent DNA helicase n=1 Tax=Rhizophagus clarus TaxID=94130 RepID=A0A2Z6QIE7_9GLOM|nr:hypothetical protein RclHR1_01610006 [Rhizophagus clarus]